MSLPAFPVIDSPLTLEECLNMMLASIAMAEAGLSHIINAEGEKLQYIPGMLEHGPEERPSVAEVLAVNKSIKCLMDSIMQNQVILKAKMDSVLCALEPSFTGPTGATGGTGPSGGDTGLTGPTDFRRRYRANRPSRGYRPHRRARPSRRTGPTRAARMPRPTRSTGLPGAARAL